VAQALAVKTRHGSGKNAWAVNAPVAGNPKILCIFCLQDLMEPF
jgi:hypothetical protein